MVTASGVAGEGGRWGPDAEVAAISCHISVPKSLASGGDPNRRTPGPVPIRAGPRRRLRHWPPPRRGGIPIDTRSEEVPLSHIVTDQDRGPRPRGRQRRLSPPSVAPPIAGTAQLFSGEVSGPDRQAARLGLSRRHRHDDTGRSTTTTTTAPGATRLSSIASSRSTPWRRHASRPARRATRSPSRPWPTVPSS